MGRDEIRAALGTGEIFGLREEGEEHHFAARDPEDGLIYIAGRPAGGEIRAAVARSGGASVVVSQLEDASHVAAAPPGWNVVRAVLHLLGDADRLPRVPAGAVRLLEPSDALDGLPPDLQVELRVAVGRSPVAAGLEEGRLVSFCYAAAWTESLWDVSIDTLEEFRRRGHAARFVAFMVGLMERGPATGLGRGGVEPGFARVGGQARISPGGRAGDIPARGRLVEDLRYDHGYARWFRVGSAVVLYQRPEVSTSERRRAKRWTCDSRVNALW